MSQPQTPPLLSSFSDLADPRVERARHHELLDIVGLTVRAVIAGADDRVHVPGHYRTLRNVAVADLTHAKTSHRPIVAVQRDLVLSWVQNCPIRSG